MEKQNRENSGSDHYQLLFAQALRQVFLGMQQKRFDVQSRWFSGSAALLTYDLDELLGTKLRALYQRQFAYIPV